MAKKKSMAVYDTCTPREPLTQTWTQEWCGEPGEREEASDDEKRSEIKLLKLKDPEIGIVSIKPMRSCHNEAWAR